MSEQDERFERLKRAVLRVHNGGAWDEESYKCLTLLASIEAELTEARELLESVVMRGENPYPRVRRFLQRTETPTPSQETDHAAE